MKTVTFTIAHLADIYKLYKINENSEVGNHTFHSYVYNRFKSSSSVKFKENVYCKVYPFPCSEQSV